MKLNSLNPITARSQKRLGRGYGSGKGGHTSSRGQKGQKSRTSVPAHFVGTSWVWFKRLPFLRGKSRFNSLTPTLTLTLQDLEQFAEGSVITLESLVKKGLIRKTTLNRAKVKVVQKGQITKKVEVQLPVSSGAQKAIEKAGGKVSGQNI